MQKRSIRTNLLWVVLAALGPLVIMSAWQVSLAVSDSRELVAMRLRASAWSIAESERDPFIIARHSLVMLSAQPVIRQTGAGCNTLLADAMRDADGIINFVRADATGRARCSALPFSGNIDLSHNRWWNARRGRMTLYLASPEMGAISRRPLLLMVLPLARPDGSFDGTLSAGVSIEALQRSLAAKSVGRGVIFVVNASGDPVIATGNIAALRFDNVAGARTVPRYARSADGRRWTFVSAPLFGDELHVVYAEPSSATLLTALQRIWPSLLLPLIALVLTSAAIWIATRWLVVRWLEKLRALTARFARGDFRSEQHAFERAPAELSDFADDLHDMALAIDRQERDLRDALSAKTALTKEVNHRVKNNLQIVNSLLTLQGERITDPAARLALGQAKSRISALGLIHRLLYDDDSGAEPGRVNMNRLLAELCAQLRAAFRDQPGIALHCEAADFSLVADLAIPATLFVVESVSNAFQHAFASQATGRIDVTVQVADGIAVIQVADDGGGFDTADPQGQMGMDLMRGFADQLHGALEINGRARGSLLSLRFPI